MRGGRVPDQPAVHQCHRRGGRADRRGRGRDCGDHAMSDFDDDKTWLEVESLLATMAAQQEGKVLGLARRLKPGVTSEDVRNPHDFDELADPDFNYEDGILAGLQYALTALRARRRDLAMTATTAATTATTTKPRGEP